MTHYGVLVTGYGKRRRYTIREIYWCGSSAPIDGVVYRKQRWRRRKRLGLKLKLSGTVTILAIFAVNPPGPRESVNGASPLLLL